MSTVAPIARSVFNRSHSVKTTFDAGDLIPVYVDEALPSDTFKLNMTYFCRIQTLLRPLMDELYLKSEFWAVPVRLIWDNWERFNGSQDNPGDSTDYIIPQMKSPDSNVEGGTGYATGTLSDYFGIPINVPGLEHSALYHRAYHYIWNDRYRDQNLQNMVTVNLDDGPDDGKDLYPLKRGKAKDYFTGCLPWPQKNQNVNIPVSMGGQVPVISDGKEILFTQSSNPDVQGVPLSVDASNKATSLPGWSGASGTISFDKSQTGLKVDLVSPTSGTINELRQAFQLQRMFEKDARGGTRYTEINYTHFGARSSDARMQRAEYLGGASTPLIVTPVAGTTNPFSLDENDTEASTPLGILGAYGVFSSRTHGFSRSFTEHTIIVGLVSVTSNQTYQQGLPRMFSRRTRYDFYWPSFAHLGEQTVLNKEIYAQGSKSPDQDNAVFGYQERYADYRFRHSMVTGRFRSDIPDNPLPKEPKIAEHVNRSYDLWHLAQKFDNLPTLSSQFIQEDPPIHRVVAVPPKVSATDVRTHAFLFDSYFHLRTARPMPAFGSPGFTDRF